MRRNENLQSPEQNPTERELQADLDTERRLPIFEIHEPALLAVDHSIASPSKPHEIPSSPAPPAIGRNPAGLADFVTPGPAGPAAEIVLDEDSLLPTRKYARNPACPTDSKPAAEIVPAEENLFPIRKSARNPACPTDPEPAAEIVPTD